MRQKRIAQVSIFENFSQHEKGIQLKKLSDMLDDYPEILDLVEQDLLDSTCQDTGANGLSVENIFRSLLLKQQLQCSYEQLSFHLSDSMSYRSFVRLPSDSFPSRSGLQSVIRKITPETLEAIHEILIKRLHHEKVISPSQIRIDSTVVKSNIVSPSDSQLLNDSVRVLSRLLAKCRTETGVNVRFHDQRKPAKSLAFRIFNAKKAEKNALYPELLKKADIVLEQVNRGLNAVNEQGVLNDKTIKWLNSVEHYKALLMQVIDQTTRRVLNNEAVPSSEKIVSIFEEHTDIIVKGFRDVQYGHKVNMASDRKGFITSFSIEKGNPKDSEIYLPVIHKHKDLYNNVPQTTACDGCYASKDNTKKARDMGVKRTVFNKKNGLSYHQMGVKEKTFKKIKNFRAGIEANVSELKRTFGAGCAKWKKKDGFEAFVWSSVITYNLVRLARSTPG